MTIEILCNGCDDCDVLIGKVCQAVSDLNLDADILSDHDSRKHVSGLDCVDDLKLKVNGITVSTKRDCSVRDLMLMFNKELHLSL